MRAGARRRGIQVAGALALATLAGCGGPRGLYWPVVPPDTPAPKLVDERANGTRVDLARTQWLLVRLPLASGSPLRWSPDVSGERNVYPSGNTPRFETDDSGTLNEIFTFRAEGAGTSRLAFAYRNPEMPDEPAARSIAFDVDAH